MIHYHGTPITPRRVLNTLAGHHFCVSFANPCDIKACHKLGQSVMLDNGAYSFWRRQMNNPLMNAGPYVHANWSSYYAWCKKWLIYPTTWAVIPDVIDGTEEENDKLLAQWFAELKTFRQAAPVWHLHESLERLGRLISGFDRVCFGSSKQFATVGTARWHRRACEAFSFIASRRDRLPWIHMLRGMKLSGSQYPFASVDSTDVGRNHNRNDRSAVKMVAAWDAQQCPGEWVPVETQMEIIDQKL